MVSNQTQDLEWLLDLLNTYNMQLQVIISISLIYTLYSLLQNTQSPLYFTSRCLVTAADCVIDAHAWSSWLLTLSHILLTLFLTQNLFVPSVHQFWFSWCSLGFDPIKNTALNVSFIVVCLSLAAVMWCGCYGSMFAEPFHSNRHLISFYNSAFEWEWHNRDLYFFVIEILGNPELYYN
jgi:hypothetical protein